jgi:hypothetical protein
MHLTILETGRPPELIRGHFPDYPAMFESLLLLLSWTVMSCPIQRRPMQR